MLVAFLAAVCSAVAQGETPHVVKVATPPPLETLPMSIHGRFEAKASAGLDLPGFPKQDIVSQWPGAYYQAAFQGDAVYFRVGAAHEILHVVVDKRTLVLDKPEPGVYEVTGLSGRKHRVSIYVATESMSNPNHFGGFALAAGAKPLVVVVLPRQIEFIGDSHTVGFGNTSAKRECSDEEIWSTTDNTQTFAALTAARLHANYEVNAISGRGIVRNYSGFPADTLPEAYPYVLFDKAQKVDEPDWNPQLIVIALGTNDFSTALHAGEKWKSRDELHADYEATYVRFLQDLRARNPHAYFILWATNLADGEIAAEEQRVVDRMRASGEQNIGFLEFKHLALSGCAGHPSVADDRTISKALVRYVKAHPGIFRGE
ncbi:GDSL-type esterase/lipase family protein [Silvibacterium sp.]|uniref:SGNH/GDSL hydrolase family protein n=1 Tax=Silvibacterium sp. TaxID=1964179 RepID=UPI0039E2B904